MSIGKRILSAMAGVALCSAAAVPALAAYPDRPITMIVPFGAGGTGDIGVRTWTPYLERCLGAGAQVVVVNKPGAGGYNGFIEIANAPADGYTLGALNVPNVPTSIITRPDAGITIDSFKYLGAFYGSVITLSTSANSPLKDVAGVIEAGKAKPLNVAMSAIGSDDHLFVLQFMKFTGVSMTPIPLEGEAPVRNAVIGGQVDLASISASGTIPFLDQMRPLGVAAEKRVEGLPDVPTFMELGYDVIGGTKHLFGAPADLPDDIAATLAACFEKIAVDPAFLADAKQRSLLVDPMNAEQASAFAHKQYEDLKAIWDKEPWIK